MPIYLVRWPDLSAALVKASSEDELVEILDEVANPDGSTWSVYRGPLFLEFSCGSTRWIAAHRAPRSPHEMAIAMAKADLATLNSRCAPAFP